MSLTKQITQTRIWGERAVEMCRKAPQAAASPSAMIAAGEPFAQNYSTGRASNQLSHFRGHAYTAIAAIAKRIAGQPIHVYSSRTASRGLTLKSIKAANGDGWQEVENHPLALTLQDPNPIMVAWSLMFSTVASLNLTGRGLWWFTKSSTGGLDIWPIPPHWAEPGDAMRSFWKIRPFGRAEPINVSGEMVAYFCLPDPSDPFGAVSPLQAQAAAIDTDEALQQAQAHSFHNIVRPGLILKAGHVSGADGTPGPRVEFTPEQRHQLITSIKNRYRGVHQNGEPLILDALIEDVFELDTKSEMDWLKSGDQTRGRIFHAFGVNPLIVGEISGANRAQAVAAEESFCSNVINPLLMLMNQTLNGWVAPLFAGEGEQLLIEIEAARARSGAEVSRVVACC